MVSSSSRTTSVRYTSRVVARMLTVLAGLISQVAEELWEVKDRKIKNLTKEDITIVDYKNLLVKNSASLSSLSSSLSSHISILLCTPSCFWCGAC